MLPVDASTIPLAPSSFATVISTADPLSLNEPVGFLPSTLKYRLIPNSLPIIFTLKQWCS
ncbi:hypothetical protein IU50_00185 [Francisella tularensis]|nr:hypothetical protein AAX59_05860 [Francisella tularensis subsp. holarctica]KXO27775.1 hypothetical protein IU42_00300 [Francisella tularensis]KHS54544.1 hypothetical protein RB23_06055 [Francisella tularensis subsp. holarctica]KXO28692.1 hypothetical protein IU45_00185 [Francisella tularensis]KXO29344.1 hypothetical protein IU50_00185 [Francisella tularensis]